MDDLSRFILASAGEPLRYRHSDCAPWLLRWIGQRSGCTAPMPRYASRRGALRVIRAHGGVIPLFSGMAAQMGLEATDSPARGDVGVIAHERALTGFTGGIATAPGEWAVKLHDGHVTILTAPAVIAWSVPRRCI